MKKIAQIISLLAIIFSVFWFIYQPDFEPVITSLFGIAGFITSLKYTKKDAKPPIKPETEIALNINKRPVIDLEATEIKYGSWTEAEKKSHEKQFQEFEKINLYFKIHNLSQIPAVNLEIKGISEIIDEKGVGKFLPEDWDSCPYQHNKHIVTNREPARQPFILGLDKKALSHFKNGDIKVKLSIKVNYNDPSLKERFKTEKVYLYSPSFENDAEELSSEIL